MNRVDPFRRATAIALIFMLGIVDVCKKEPVAPNAQPQASTQNPQQQQPTPHAELSQSADAAIPAEQPPGTPINGVTGGPPPGMFGPDALPGATILTALDPHKMSQSEIQFGVAPKRTANVEYQPDIILMEEGDKAIRSVGSEGLTWKFDASAPHVNEFAEGKVVFATGRAVGRILSLRKDGDTVSVILGSIQLGDVIKNGKFAMNQKIDPNNMISYIAADFPGAKNNPDEKKSSSTEYDDRDLNDQIQESVALSSPTPEGRWQTSSVSQTYANGRRVTDNPDWKLKVEGHTDNIGPDAHNLDLSKRRAASVKQALVDRYHIPPDRLATDGFGSAGAIDTNDTLEGRARNRRVELSRE